MAKPGYVYALTNPSFPGMVKVGRTTKTPSERAAELSSPTGVPTPYAVAYSVFVSDNEEAESLAHEMLANLGSRVRDEREFFRVEVQLAMDVLEHVKATFDGQDSAGTGSRLDLANEQFRALDDRFLKAQAKLYQGKEPAATKILRGLAQLDHLPSLLMLGTLKGLDTGERIEYLKKAEALGAVVEANQKMANLYFKEMSLFSEASNCFDKIFQFLDSSMLPKALMLDYFEKAIGAQAYEFEKMPTSAEALKVLKMESSRFFSQLGEPNLLVYPGTEGDADFVREIAELLEVEYPDLG